MDSRRVASSSSPAPNSKNLRSWLTLIVFFVLLLPPGEASHDNDWTHYVRIAGHGLRSDNASAIIAESEKSNVFGIEVDNDIPGRYESFLDPNQKLEAIRTIAQQAHRAGNKSFVYIAGLECITANADKAPHSLFKDHPHWVQRQMNGTPAVFGGGVAFWIKPGDEDVWISPYALQWRTRYMSLVRQIAATGIDGIYVDIPYWMTHFEGWEKTWASFDSYTVAAFKKTTGLDALKDIRLGDVSDPHFRRWIDFRIQTITEFMHEINTNVKAVNPHCVAIAEIYPGIESDVPRVGADVYELYPVVDTIAHEYQGRRDTMAASKSPGDWFDQLIGIFAFRAFAQGKASWMLNYSWDGEKDASIPESMKTMFAAQLTAGANSWDAQGHVMSGSNDLAIRTEVFGWIAKHQNVFYDSRDPVDAIGVYFSPQTRNYFPDDFMTSFKGTVNRLLTSHREFQIVTPRTLAQFRGPLLILPDVRCLSDDEVTAIRRLISEGHKVYMTGETGSRQADGSQRNENPLQQLTTGSNALPSALPDQPVVVNAPPTVLSQFARVHDKLHVFLDNFKGIVAKRNPLPAAEDSVSISFPGQACQKVYALPYLGESSEIPAQRSGGELLVKIPPFTRAMVVWCQ